MERIKHLRLRKAGDAGVTASDNRRFVEAVLYRYRAGIPWRDSWSGPGQACRRRKPRCMSARAPIADGGPQRLPARAAPSLATALRGARGPLHGLRGRSAADLTGPTMPMQPTLMSAAWSAATITPGFCRPVISVITITGIGDHLQPEWLITFTGMRTIGRERSRYTLVFGRSAWTSTMMCISMDLT
jgi:hypothetical protein